MKAINPEDAEGYVKPSKLPEPSYLSRGNDKGKDKGVAGRKAEKSLSKRLKGSLTPGSGNLSGRKGDLTVGEFLMENKTSTMDSFSIRKDHLYKIYQEALEVSKTPALSVQFVTSDGNSAKRDRWVMITEATFQMLFLD